MTQGGRRRKPRHLAETADDKPHYHGHRERLRQRLIDAGAAIARGIDCFVSAFDTDEPARMAGGRLAELRSRRRSAQK